ncbi:hypothetical protein ACROYT_G013333, partial [Oculina patagonica]
SLLRSVVFFRAHAFMPRYQRSDNSTTALTEKYRAKMAEKAKRLSRFSRLETIMEATQREESDNGGCFLDLYLPQKSVTSSNERDSVGGETMQDLEALRRNRIVLSSSTRIRNKSEQKEHKRSPLCNVSSAVSIRTEHAKQAHNSEMAKKDSHNARDIKQVEMLFPEFFSSRANTHFVQQSDWYYNNNLEKNVVLVNEKIKEDPFIQSWLNLFGAYTCM